MRKYATNWYQGIDMMPFSFFYPLPPCGFVLFFLLSCLSVSPSLSYLFHLLSGAYKIGGVFFFSYPLSLSLSVYLCLSSYLSHDDTSPQSRNIILLLLNFVFPFLNSFRKKTSSTWHCLSRSWESTSRILNCSMKWFICNESSSSHSESSENINKKEKKNLTIKKWK